MDFGGADFPLLGWFGKGSVGNPLAGGFSRNDWGKVS
jgi:hypothetical protein